MPSIQVGLFGHKLLVTPYYPTYCPTLNGTGNSSSNLRWGTNMSVVELPQHTLPSHSYVAESTTQVIWGLIRLRAISNNWNLEVCQEVLWSLGHFFGAHFTCSFKSKPTGWSSIALSTGPSNWFYLVHPALCQAKCLLCCWFKPRLPSR